MEKTSPLLKVYGTVTVGERGQVVVPAKIRKMYGLSPGDKLIVLAREGAPIGFVPVSAFNAFIEQHEQFITQMKKNTGA
ncbi:MAG TPA: AbrB/MazE/SpoVT family DNA-binding domain-containing protein [Candidatus Omnitrophota bacterium]|nr:AbrB/MazE/SpoVT family DNA-binding domain-containing protein [Candidatus Omnitrophota bacterium]HQJ15019.1 AbrB/MazE/SpoVT family DNA-binding domain-containing protein [Candidatus Omnitrophota bacterium]